MASFVAHPLEDIFVDVVIGYLAIVGIDIVIKVVLALIDRSCLLISHYLSYLID